MLKDILDIHSASSTVLSNEHSLVKLSELADKVQKMQLTEEQQVLIKGIYCLASG